MQRKKEEENKQKDKLAKIDERRKSVYDKMMHKQRLLDREAYK